MRHLRTVWDFEDGETLDKLLTRSQQLKRDRRDRRLAPSLNGRVVGMLFERESTRTRMSFEAGVATLGGSTVVMQARDMQLSGGEEPRDVARVTSRYVDALVVRAPAHAMVEEFARHARVPVLNGMSDLDHPCQVLADLFTVYEMRQEPSAQVWAWVGDGNHIANGLIAAAALTGIELRIAVPKGHDPDPGYLAKAKERGAKVSVTHNPKEAVAGADVVYTHQWGLGQEGGDRRRRLFAPFQLNAELLSVASEEHLVLHCLPAQRGEEITDNVLEGRHSVAFQQAGNRLVVQQAILEHVLEILV